jgi:hypothetical protein
MIDPKEFDAIRPYNNDEIPGVVDSLLHDRLMNAQLKTLLPWLPQWLRNGVLRLAFIGIHSTLDFQLRFMKPVVKYVLRKCSNGATFEHSKITAGKERYTFMSNHRDIVLDSAILDYLLYKNKFPTTCEIAIGDNLLIYPWIEKLVKLNKAFTVRRGLGSKDLLKSSMLMSQYIHYAVNQKHENIWIAQREGRAKDSSDTTQESVLKMLAMGSEEENPIDQLRDLNIVPLTISYEYDPCDYLKATEFQLKRDNPAYKKSKADDENNMREGIWGFKGSIHYEAAHSINTWLDELKDLPKNEFFTEVAHRIDKQIHAGYKLFPGNYVAADLLNGASEFASFYTEAQKAEFLNYLQQRLDKIEIENKDEAFLRERLLTMYANPVFNKQKALKS